MFEDKEYLYHYTSAEATINYILKNKTLRLGNFKTVNDPRESKLWPFKFLCFKSETKEKFNSNLFEKVHDYIVDRAFVVCLKKDNMGNCSPNDVNSIRGYSDSRMWAQYGSNHKGVCLVFNKEKLSNKINETFKNDLILNDSIKYIDYFEATQENQDKDPYMIFYEKMLEEGFDKYLDNHVKKFYKELFFEKQKCWKDEEEYRWVIYSKDVGVDKYIDISNCLEAVILGNDFDNNVLDDIVAYCKDLKIKLYKLFNRGWAQYLFECDLNNVHRKDAIPLNISYPINFYYELLFTQACNIDGERKTILLDFPNNGSVILYD